MTQEPTDDPTAAGRSEALDAALARIGAAQFGRVAEGLAGRPDRDTGTHEARKALKRLRALLRLVRPHADRDRYKATDVAMRDLGRALAPLRDSWVSLETLDRVAPGRCPRLRELLVARHEGAIDSISPAMFESLAVAAGEAADRWRALLPSGIGAGLEAVTGGLGRTYSRGRKRMKRVLDHGGDGEYHSWRREVKHLRYQMEAIVRIVPEVGERVTALDDLGEILGLEHDLTVLLALADQRGDCGGEREVLLEILAEERSRLRADALVLGESAYRETREEMLAALGGSRPADESG